MSIGVTISSANVGKYVVPSSVQWSHTLGERGSGSCLLRVADGSGYVPAVGQDVGFWDGDTRVFGGTIESFTRKRLGARSSPVIEYSLAVSSQERHADKRIIESRSYQSTTAGSIVADILARELALEALSGTIGPGADITSIVFDHVTCAEAFNQLANLSNYVWSENPDGYVSFVPRSTTPSSYVLTGADVLMGASIGENRSDYRNRQHLRVNWAAFADTVESFWGDGATTVFDLAKDPADIVSITIYDGVYASVAGTFSGIPSDGDTAAINGVTYTFRTALTQTNPREVLIGATPAACALALAQAVNRANAGYGTLYSSSTSQHPNCLCSQPVGATIVAYFATAGLGDGAPVSATGAAFAWASSSMSGAGTGATTTQTFGTAGSSSQWYWAAGNVEISQADTTTPLPSTSVLVVQYRQLGGDVISITDWTEVAARQAVEGGSGIYENFSEDTSIVDGNLGLAKCQALLDAYKHIPTTIDYDTLKHDLEPGQVITVTLSSPDVSGLFMVQSMDGLYHPTFEHFSYRVKLIDQTRIATWLQFWEGLTATGGTTTSAASTTGEAVVAGPAPLVSFEAGTRNLDGSYSAAMQWNTLGTAFIVQFKCSIASLSNFTGVKIAITPPDSSAPQVVTPLLEPFAPNGAGAFVYEGELEIDAAMLGGVIPASPVNLVFTAASVNVDGVMNVDSSGYPTGPTVTLATLDPASAPTLLPTPPAQPASFTASVIATGYSAAAGQAQAEVQVSIANTTGAKYFSVWAYAGASAPSSPSAWGAPVLNVALASSSPTIGEWWTNRSFSAAITMWLRVRASSSTYTANPSDAGPSDVSVTIPQVGSPAQPTGFSVSLLTRTTASGVPEGALVCVWTPPSDIEYFSANVYAIDTDSSYTPLSGSSYRLVGNAVSAFDQSALNPPQWWTMGDSGYLTLKVQSVGRAIDPSTGKNIENTAGAPTFNLHVSGSPGLDTSKLATPVQSTQLASGIINSLSFFGSPTLRPLVATAALPSLPDSNYPVGSMLVLTTDGKPYRNVANVWKAGTAAGDITAGTLISGVVYAGAIAVSQLTAGTATFTSDVLFYRDVYNWVAINSSGLQISGYGGSILSMLSTGVLLRQGSGGPSVTITSSGLTMASGYGPSVSVSSYALTLSNGSYGSVTITSSGITLTQGSSGPTINFTGSGLYMKSSFGGAYNNIAISTSGAVTIADNYGNVTYIGGYGLPGINCNGIVQASGLRIGGYNGLTESVDVNVGTGIWRLFFSGGAYRGHSVIA